MIARRDVHPFNATYEQMRMIARRDVPFRKTQIYEQMRMIARRDVPFVKRKFMNRCDDSTEDVT
jgi:hypothetical protein